MNIENVNKLIDHLESIEDFEYDQETYTHGCGSPACVGGHAAYLARIEGEIDIHLSMELIAQSYLGICNHDRERMFSPDPLNQYKRRIKQDVTKQDAINMLKNFSETGKVVWEKVI